MPISAELEALLQAEQSLADQLVDCLNRERTLLESRELRELPELMDCKAALLEQIESTVSERTALIQRTLEQDNSDTHAADASEILNVRLAEIQNLYKKINYFNELNGLLIANSRKRARLQLDIMRGIPEQDQVYDKSGTTRNPPVSQNLSSA